MKNGFSVIMPTYNQATFIRRAITSLLSQTYNLWELIIINDGSTDETIRYIKDFLNDSRITYIENNTNRGLGAAINQGLDIAKYNYITYLPSDDFYYIDHLETVKKELDSSDDIILTYTKGKSEITDSLSHNSKNDLNGLFYGYALQLVQTAHKNTLDRWVERSECLSSDYFFMFWNKLIDKGVFTYIDKETSNWTIHHYQYHSLFNRGVNNIRQYYNIQEPIKMRVSKHQYIDEIEIYKNFRPSKMINQDKKPKLKVLLVGELAYHPERIYALEEHGCKLYGLWMRNPTFDFSMVGHLPFGDVTDIPFENWEDKVREIKPDIIYASLNFGAVPIAYDVMKECSDIPFVWHFKEGPSICMQNGTWEKLIELYNKADGKIYLNEESKNWYQQFIPETGLSFILDGDLPKIEYFSDIFSRRLSEDDNAIHTVVTGRLIGVTIDELKVLANHNIHLHLYTRGGSQHIKSGFSKDALAVIPNHFHLHSHCAATDWTKEFSKYDAGWLHSFDSNNFGNISRMGWNDLNMPARITTLAAAGLPMIQKDNKGHIVGMQSHIQKHNLGIFYENMEDLVSKLCNRSITETVRANVIKDRYTFSFDYNVPKLLDFFQTVIDSKKIKHYV